MERRAGLSEKAKDQRGATLVFVALLMSVFIGVAALAIDIGHLVVVHGELQNAADAGALAGASSLYYGDPPPPGGTVGCLNPGAVQIANDTAILNDSEKVAVEVNSGDVITGNWNPSTRTFTARPLPVGLCNYSAPEPIVNAVRVIARRETTPVASFFASIFSDFDSFTRTATATAWIDSPGPPIEAGEFDQPIVICQESLTDGCNIGRMINSGGNIDTSNTGGWTDFNQDNPCNGGTNANDIRATINRPSCVGGNTEDIVGPITTNGGQITSAFNDLKYCWEAQTNMTQPWELTLPIVSCPGNNLGPCSTVTGAVHVEVVWITGNGSDPDYSEVPTQMGDWSSTTADGQTRWGEFVTHYQLKNVDGSDAPYQMSAIYFKPTCEMTQLAGLTGGSGFNVLARSPVLVQ